MNLLHGKHVLVTGVVNTDSIAYAAASRILATGGEIILTSFDRDWDRTTEAAQTLAGEVSVLELDVTDETHLERLEADLRKHWPCVDGVLHAVAFAPRAALAGNFLDAGSEAAQAAFATSSYSYASLARLLDRLAPSSGGAIVGLDFDAGAAWPVYNWMGVAKAALESVSRYVARDLGPRSIRSNLVAAGPLHTRAAGGIPAFERLTEAWEAQSPMRWDPTDPGPVADAVCFLLSDLARGVSGEILHVDGGYHAMAGPLDPDRFAQVPTLNGSLPAPSPV